MYELHIFSFLRERKETLSTYMKKEHTPEEKYNMGKGSARRPGNRESFREGFDRIFNKSTRKDNEGTTTKSMGHNKRKDKVLVG